MLVEIHSDIVCPWCYIGKRRFETALARYDGAVDVEWKPFELDATVPAGGIDLHEYYAAKFGGHAPDIHDRMIETAAGVGLHYVFGPEMRRPNTFAAHRLLWWARAVDGAGAQSALAERVFAAYFTDGRDVGEPTVLTDLAAQVGLDRDAAAKALASGTGADEVRTEQRHGRELGITAVPMFVFDGRFGIPGAQDPSVFLRALERFGAREASEIDSASAPNRPSGRDSTVDTV